MTNIYTHIWKSKGSTNEYVYEPEPRCFSTYFDAMVDLRDAKPTYIDEYNCKYHGTYVEDRDTGSVVLRDLNEELIDWSGENPDNVSYIRGDS